MPPKPPAISLIVSANPKAILDVASFLPPDQMSIQSFQSTAWCVFQSDRSESIRGLPTTPEQRSGPTQL